MLRRVGTAAVMATGMVIALSGCAKRPRAGGAGLPAPEPRADPVALTDATHVYQSMGLLASPGPVPFVGSVAYLAGPTPDSTVAFVTLSLANRALTFTRDGDRFRAGYQVQLEFRQGAALVRHVEAQEVVRVGSFKETARGDESIIFQQLVIVPPGQYVVAFAVRDAGGGKSATQETLLTVPRLGAGSLSTPITVLDATPRGSTDSVPRIVASPRSTVSFGRDTTVPVYLEGYGTGARLPVTVAVRGDRGGALWTDTVSLENHGALFSGVINVPVARLGVGVTTLVASRSDSQDTTRTPVFVSFGDELPVASFDEMVNYLRYFTTPARLQALRGAAPEQRAAAWATFLRETDPVPSTSQHEGLSDYFGRIRVANERFREEGVPGWTTDRGMVFVALGEPDQLYEQGGTDINQRGRAQVWEYRQNRLQLIFVDQTGFGRWRLTTGSEADFQQAVRRVQKQ